MHVVLPYFWVKSAEFGSFASENMKNGEKSGFTPQNWKYGTEE